MQYSIVVADDSHQHYAESICTLIEDAAKVRGTGIAKRDPNYIRLKITDGKAILAFDEERVVGFCYIETWEGQKYVANSGLIVHPDCRKTGLASAIKKATFNLSKKKFPNARLFGITTSLAVMKINSDLGYKPVTFSELTQDEEFWKGCQGCVNYDILQRNNQKMCLCTGMACDLSQIPDQVELPTSKKKAWGRFMDFLKTRKARIQHATKLLISKNED